MSDAKVSNTHCAVRGCKMSIFNKPPGITFHQFPSNSEMRTKWMMILKDKCPVLNWSKSKLCSKHFEQKYFDSGRTLRDNAIPTIFPKHIIQSSTPKPAVYNRTRVDRLLNKLTQAELVDDIKSTMQLIKVPTIFSDYVGDDLQCLPDTPVEAQLWLLIKKQDHLITRLTQLVSQNKKHVEVLQKNMEESRSSKKELEESVESYKYIVKCLQEKHATLEEQIEILTTVESR